MTPLHSCEISEIEKTDLSIVSAKHAQITEMYLTESTRVVRRLYIKLPQPTSKF